MLSFQYTQLGASSLLIAKVRQYDLTDLIWHLLENPRFCTLSQWLYDSFINDIYQFCLLLLFNITFSLGFARILQAMFSSHYFHNFSQFKDVAKMPLYRSGLGLGYPYSSSLLHPSAPYVPPAPLSTYAPPKVRQLYLITSLYI